MHILRVRRWVIWWIYIGLICGTVAVVNILGHNLTRSQDQTLIILGIAHWLLGGIVCWVFEGVEIKSGAAPRVQNQKTPDTLPATEWHPASDFLLPGSRRSPFLWRH